MGFSVSCRVSFHVSRSLTPNLHLMRRTVHYGAPPTGDNARMATCSFLLSLSPRLVGKLSLIYRVFFFSDVCYKPASLITPEQLAVKQDAFHNQQNTVSSIPPLFLSRSLADF